MTIIIRDTFLIVIVSKKLTILTLAFKNPYSCDVSQI